LSRSNSFGMVSFTAASTTRLLLVSRQGLTTARDDTLQYGARTTVHALSVLHTASHTLSALSTSASALSYTQCPYLQPMCKFLPRYLHTFIPAARLLLLLPLLLRRRIMIGPAPMGIQIFRTLSYRRMGLEAAALLNFSQLFFVSRKRDCSGGMYISYSVVSKKNEDFNSCHVCRLFSGLAKKG
jgi:hypothetical protein